MISTKALNSALALLLLFVFPTSLPQARRLTADELVRKALDARGGIQKIKAIQSERIAGTISFGPGAGGPFFVELKRPGKMHMEIVIQDRTIIRVYDGRTGWMLNPFTENKGPVEMSANDLKNITDESDFDGPLVDYQAKGNKVEYLGADDVDGKPVEKLKLTVKSGEVRTYFLDAATFLLLKWEGVRQGESGEFRVVSLFRDYREVDGVKFAFEVDTGSLKGDQQQQLTIEKIELNPAIDETRFEKPREPAPAPPPK